MAQQHVVVAVQVGVAQSLTAAACGSQRHISISDVSTCDCRFFWCALRPNLASVGYITNIDLDFEQKEKIQIPSLAS